MGKWVESKLSNNIEDQEEYINVDVGWSGAAGKASLLNDYKRENE